MRLRGRAESNYEFRSHKFPKYGLVELFDRSYHFLYGYFTRFLIIAALFALEILFHINS